MPRRISAKPSGVWEPWQRGFIREFQERFGRPPVLDAPQRYTDKLAWRILFENDPLSRIYGNALFAPYYARSIAGDELALATRYGIYRQVSPQDLDRLPNRFRLRASHGNRPAIWVDRSAGHNAEASKRAVEDLNTMIGRPDDQWRPQPASVAIVAEEWPADDSDHGLTSFRFHCFPGSPGGLAWILEVDHPHSDSKSIGLYDETLQPVGLKHWAGRSISQDPFTPPANWKQIVRAATALSSDFDYVRVDLFYNQVGIIFDGIEAFPTEALLPFKDPQFDRWLGGHWILHGDRSPPRSSQQPRPPEHTADPAAFAASDLRMKRRRLQRIPSGRATGLQRATPTDPAANRPPEEVQVTANDAVKQALSGRAGNMNTTVRRDRTVDQFRRTIATSHGNALIAKYIERNGIQPNLHDPRTFSEKLLVRTAYSRDPLHCLYSDKLISPYFAAAKAGELLDFPTRYGVYEMLTVDDLQALPKSFVLKGSHASGVNRLIVDRDDEDLQSVAEWMNSRFKIRRNAQGKADESAVIIAEEFLGSETKKPPADMKFHCFRSDEGRFRWFLQEFHGRFENTRRLLFDDDLRPAEFDFKGKITEPGTTFKPPPRFEDMVEISRRISEGFDYIRVDLYNLDGRIVFGEITPFHAGGSLAVEPRLWDYRLGRRWGGDPSRVAPREGSPQEAVPIDQTPTIGLEM